MVSCSERLDDLRKTPWAILPLALMNQTTRLDASIRSSSRVNYAFSPLYTYYIHRSLCFNPSSPSPCLYSCHSCSFFCHPDNRREEESRVHPFLNTFGSLCSDGLMRACPNNENERNVQNRPFHRKMNRVNRLETKFHEYRNTEKKECKPQDLHSSSRRERDSNPRYLSVQRFSRPPQSTTLPSLQNSFQEGFLSKAMQRYNLFLNLQAYLHIFSKKSLLSIEKYIIMYVKNYFISYLCATKK